MRGERRTGLRGLVVVASILTVVLGFGSAALAQLPTLPSAPALPPQVQGAIDTVETTAYPYLFTAAETAAPVATLGGFALRPACGELGLAAFAIGLGGAALPVNVLGLSGPAFIFCGASFEPGPVDPYLDQVDAAVGPTISAQWHSVAPKVAEQLAAYPGWRNELCGGVELAYPTSLLPKPTDRLDPSQAVC